MPEKIKVMPLEMGTISKKSNNEIFSTHCFYSPHLKIYLNSSIGGLSTSQPIIIARLFIYLEKFGL